MDQDIRRHIVRTYVNLRIGMAVIALALPVVLLLSSLLNYDYGILSSLSAYYHTPMRNIFVGALITVGACLYLYKGFIKRENQLLNIAGVVLVAMALVPTRVPDAILIASPGWLPIEPFSAPELHGAFAIVFFLIMAYVCINCSSATVALIRDENRKNRYRTLYRIYGILMVVLPAGVAALTYYTDTGFAITAAETIALWVFAAFWYTKSREVARQASVLELELIIDPEHGGVTGKLQP